MANSEDEFVFVTMASSDDEYVEVFVDEDEEVNFMVDPDESSSTGSMPSSDSDADDCPPSPKYPVGWQRNVLQNAVQSTNLGGDHRSLNDINQTADVSIADIVKYNVLPFLPAKSLCRFRAVSKEWNMWIGLPLLAHSQTTLFQDFSGLLYQFPGEEPNFISLDPYAYNIPCPSLSFLPEPVDIRSTCNGLLACQSPVGDNSYYICSPATKQWRKLPEPKLYHGPNTAIALAFEPQTLSFSEHYQLICAVPVPDQPVLYFEIFSSRSNCWRVARTECCYLDAVELNGDGFYLGGYVYWESRSGVLLAFNVKDEDYGFLRLPPGNNCAGALSGMNGELCYFLPRERDGEISIEVYGDMDMRLKRTVYLNRRIMWYEHCRALASAGDDTLIISLGDSVFAFNTRTRQERQLSCLARTDGFVKYLPYVNSLATVSHLGSEQCSTSLHEVS